MTISCLMNNQISGKLSNELKRACIHTCVFGNIVQQEWVLGESLHFYRNDVFKLQPATQTVSLSFLKQRQTAAGMISI